MPFMNTYWYTTLKSHIPDLATTCLNIPSKIATCIYLARFYYLKKLGPFRNTMKVKFVPNIK